MEPMDARGRNLKQVRDVIGEDNYQLMRKHGWSITFNLQSSGKYLYGKVMAVFYSGFAPDDPDTRREEAVLMATVGLRDANDLETDVINSSSIANHLFIHSFIHPSTHSFIHSFIRSFVRSFIHSPIHSIDSISFRFISFHSTLYFLFMIL